MRLWYLSHRPQASLHIHAVSPEPSLFAHMKYGSRRKVRPKIRHLVPLVGGERGGSVVECRTLEREVGGLKPTAAVLCP